MSSSRFLTGSCEKNCHRGGKGGKFALASGEEANNREKAREVYCLLLVILVLTISLNVCGLQLGNEDPCILYAARKYLFLCLCIEKLANKFYSSALRRFETVTECCENIVRSLTLEQRQDNN